MNFVHKLKKKITSTKRGIAFTIAGSLGLTVAVNYNVTNHVVQRTKIEQQQWITQFVDSLPDIDSVFFDASAIVIEFNDSLLANSINGISRIVIALEDNVVEHDSLIRAIIESIEERLMTPPAAAPASTTLVRLLISAALSDTLHVDTIRVLDRSLRIPGTRVIILPIPVDTL